jgi:UrcA family protein
MKKLSMLIVVSWAMAPAASQAEEPISVGVSYADLNLSSTTGQQILQRRIAYAAMSVCGVADHRDLKFSSAVSDCRAGAIGDAQPAYAAAVAAARHGMVEVLGAALIVTAPR